MLKEGVSIDLCCDIFECGLCTGFTQREQLCAWVSDACTQSVCPLIKEQPLSEVDHNSSCTWLLLHSSNKKASLILKWEGAFNHWQLANAISHGLDCSLISLMTPSLNWAQWTKQYVWYVPYLSIKPWSLYKLLRQLQPWNWLRLLPCLLQADRLACASLLWVQWEEHPTKILCFLVFSWILWNSLSLSPRQIAQLLWTLWEPTPPAHTCPHCV